MLPITHVIACPHCAALTLHQPRWACIQFRRRVWSDGYALPEEAPPCTLLRCQSCTQFFWQEQAVKVGSFRPYPEASCRQLDPAWLAAPWVAALTEAQCAQALTAGLARTREQERVLRTWVWWRGNDRFRDLSAEQALGRRARRRLQRTPAALPVSDGSLPHASRENLHRLLPLLSPWSQAQLLLKACALLQLGEFDQADDLLSWANAAQDAVLVRQLQMQCAAREAGVRELSIS